MGRHHRTPLPHILEGPDKVIDISEIVCIGDSIAVGLSSHLQCVPFAQVGRSSGQALALVKRINANTVVVSLGSNDPNNPRLVSNLVGIRARIEAKVVIWVIPYNSRAAASVRDVAYRFKDAVIDLRNFKTRDGVHPRSYQSVARAMPINR
jgi:hypothetical protein